MRRLVAVLALFLVAWPASAQETTVGALIEDAAPDAGDWLYLEQSDGLAANKVAVGSLAAALQLVVADLGDVDLTGLDTAGEVLIWDGVATWDVSSAPAMLTSTAVQDAQVTASSVTQHQAALSVTESQISDLAHTTLTVRESDLSPSVAGVTTISLDGCSLTDNAAGAVTITCAAGGGAAVAIDADGDATSEVSIVSGRVDFDPNDDGTRDLWITRDATHNYLCFPGTSSLCTGWALDRSFLPGLVFYSNSTASGYVNNLEFRIGVTRLAADGVSLTSPGIMHNTDRDTGVGWNGNGATTMVTDAQQSWTCDAIGGVTCYMPAVATPPTCDRVGEVYHDNTGTYCICNGAGTWTVITGMNYTGTGACTV